MTRVIVFGSRTWENVGIMQAVLAALPKRGLLIVHGDCPTGADHLAQLWAEANGIPTERHPADWTKYGKRAGPLRNAEMAQAGAAQAIGFRAAGPSPGTDSMANRCLCHGIPGGLIVENAEHSRGYDYYPWTGVECL